MSSLRVRPTVPDAQGTVLDITPQSAGWTHVGFRVLRLSPGMQYSGCESGREVCIVVLSGTATVKVNAEVFENVGHRANVFADVAPGAVYAPLDATFRIAAVTAVEIALCSAPGAPGFSARRIADADMKRIVRGEGANMRYVRNILSDADRWAHALLVVEVITPSGHWSSYPPHKHDTARPGETALEETYYHRFDPPQGFGLQRIYTDDRSLDETICIEDGDVVMVPRGYHPVGAPYGYDLYYLNVMAGPQRLWKFYNDPAHEWMLNAKTLSGKK